MMPSPIVIIRAIFETVRPVRCDNCHLRKPSFNFPVLNFHDISWCRKCTNEKLNDIGYFHQFSPLHDIVKHFRNNLEWLTGKGF